MMYVLATINGCLPKLLYLE
uniref:Uncharacterized protein n=1 Tax=Anguilla anguilla TaxID=7936 RepID=A0A0E9S657_ANGAN